MSGHDTDGGITDRGREHRRGPAGRPAPLADGDERANQSPHHVVAERVRHHGRDRNVVIIAMPGQGAQRPDGGRSFPAAAEGSEIVLAEAGKRRLVHGGDVERPEIPQRFVPAQWVRRGRGVADPIGVPAPQGREPRVELRGHRARGADADVAGQHPGQPGHRPASRLRPRGSRYVGVDDLPARVDSGVGPPGDRQLRRLRPPQHPAKRDGQGLLHRAPAGLSGPSGKPRPVVRKIKPEPNELWCFFCQANLTRRGVSRSWLSRKG